MAWAIDVLFRLQISRASSDFPSLHTAADFEESPSVPFRGVGGIETTMLCLKSFRCRIQLTYSGVPRLGWAYLFYAIYYMRRVPPCTCVCCLWNIQEVVHNASRPKECSFFRRTCIHTSVPRNKWCSKTCIFSRCRRICKRCHITPYIQQQKTFVSIRWGGGGNI